MASSTLPSNCRLVNIGTHKLALYTHGPSPQTSTEPVVFCISGIACDALNWSATTRLLPTIRCYTYDRSGCTNSSPSPKSPTAENIAYELSLLIQNAHITNPLIFVGHSWAGIMIQEYISLIGPSQIAGLVLVDANHETSTLVMNVDDPILFTVAAGVDPYAAKGLTANHKFTPEEWKKYIAAELTPNFKLQAQKENEEYKSSFVTLRAKDMLKNIKSKPLLQDKPVFVIGGRRSRDWQGLYNAGVAKGNGTEEQRKYVRELISGIDEKSEGIAKQFLKWSTRSELVFAEESGHFVQITQPEVVIKGVEWVLENLEEN